MNIPSTKEETDLVLFDLLEGNLSKKEEEFWYDYSLKNKDFAHQLELFRKIYMRDDITSYPNLSKILRKSPWYVTLRWPLMLTAGIVVMASSVLYLTRSKTDSPFIPARPAVNLPAATETIEGPEITVSAQNTKKVTKENITKESPQPHQDLKQIHPQVLTNEPQQVIGSQPVAIKDTVLIVKEEKVAEKKEAPAAELEKEMPEIRKQESTEALKAKEKKSIPLKIKVKTSKKTKTSDFNY